MNVQRKKLEPRCREIQQRFSAFLHDQLSVIARREVQGHLLACQVCSEALGELIMHEVESSAEPLRAPPRIPSLALYEHTLRGPSKRFGLSWQSLREANQAADAKARDWAQKQLTQLEDYLRRVLLPPVPVRVRGAAAATEMTLDAEVCSNTFDPVGETVPFVITQPPRITADGHFRVRLETTTAGYAEAIVVCTLRLDAILAISFTAPLRKRASSAGWEVEIDEAEIPSKEIKLSPHQLTLTLLKP